MVTMKEQINKLTIITNPIEGVNGYDQMFRSWIGRHYQRVIYTIDLTQETFNSNEFDKALHEIEGKKSIMNVIEYEGGSLGWYNESEIPSIKDHWALNEGFFIFNNNKGNINKYTMKYKYDIMLSKDDYYIVVNGAFIIDKNCQVILSNNIADVYNIPPYHSILALNSFKPKRIHFIQWF